MKAYDRHVLVAYVSLVLLFTCGCTPGEEQDIFSVLQDGVASLTAARDMTEQFARDLQANCDPSDAGYQKAEARYDIARESFNRYLDYLEGETKGSRSLGRAVVSPSLVRDDTAEFLEDASKLLKSDRDFRDVQRKIRIPDDLHYALSRLNKKERAAACAAGRPATANESMEPGQQLALIKRGR